MPVREVRVRRAGPMERTPSASALASSPKRPCGRHASCTANSQPLGDAGQPALPCRLPHPPPPATLLSLAPSTAGDVQPAHRSPYPPKQPPSGLTERTAGRGKFRTSGLSYLHAAGRALTLSWLWLRHQPTSELSLWF